MHWTYKMSEKTADTSRRYHWFASLLMTRHYKDLGSAFDTLRSRGGKEGGGGRVRKKRRREEKKERGLGKEGKERLL